MEPHQGSISIVDTPASARLEAPPDLLGPLRTSRLRHPAVTPVEQEEGDHGKSKFKILNICAVSSGVFGGCRPVFDYSPIARCGRWKSADFCNAPSSPSSRH